MGGDACPGRGWGRLLWRLLWLLLYPLAIGLKELAARNPDFIEMVYARKVYPALSTAVSALFGRMTFSFAEFLVYALLGLLLAWIIVVVVKAARRRFNLKRFVKTLLLFAIIGGLGMNAFYFMWGFNYFRYSVAYSMELEAGERGQQALEDLCAFLAKSANDLRAVQLEDADGVFTCPGGKALLLKKIPAAYEKLAADYPGFARSFTAPPKPVAASALMSRADISGIFIPFTAEANVNVHQPPLLVAASGGHETAHLMGVAREDEANFIAYLACLHSDDAAVRYSGVMSALIHAGNALYEVDPAAYRELRDSYSDGVRRDLDSHREYWAGFEGRVQETADQINDNYLKQQKQEDGLRSYGRMVDLLLDFYGKYPFEGTRGRPE